MLTADRLSGPSRRARLVEEARAASSLNHPGIVTIHAIESAGGFDFIVMELVPGKSLDALIPVRGCVSATSWTSSSSEEKRGVTRRNG